MGWGVVGSGREELTLTAAAVAYPLASNDREMEAILMSSGEKGETSGWLSS